MSSLQMLTTFLLSTLLQVPVQVAPAPAARVAQEPDHHLVHVFIEDARSLSKAMSLDLDLASCHALELPVKVLEVIAADTDIAKIRAAGLDFEVVVRNLEDEADKRLSQHRFPNTLTPPPGQGAMGGHYTLAQIVAHLDKFAKDHPSICTAKRSLGKTHEGRDIWMVKISDNVNQDENEPEVLYDSIHHAREPVGATTTLQFMDWLLTNYGKDAQATFLVNNREMFFVPCLNPDGYEYNRRTNPNGGGLWRKNRRDNGGGVFGVDLNRNWQTGWSAPNGGNSTNPRSNTYRGPSAQSEPEVQALDNFIKSRNFVVGNSCHTYTEVLLRPWGYQRGDPTNVADYRKIEAACLAQNPMRRGAASTALYIAAGTALDHYHVAHSMYGFTPELGTSSEGGFWPSPANQVRISNRHQYMFRQFAQVAGATIAVTDAQLSEGPGGNNNGKIDPGETGLLRVTIENQGAAASQGTVVATLRSLTSGVTIGRGSHSFGTVAKFATADNNAGPLTLRVAPSFSGLSAKLELTIRFEGVSAKTQLDLPFATPLPIVGTAFELDHGFRRGASDTARTGLFERAAPQQTQSGNRIYQPGADHTPAPGTRCWVTGASAGTSVGANDVDSGSTTVVSPVIDMRHIALPQLSFWLYYSESVNPGDPFSVEFSNNGGTSWAPAYSRTSSTNGWEKIEVELSGTMTAQMRFRFTAQDLAASLVEACIDDLSIEGIVESAAFTILGGAQIGSTVRLALQGQAGAIGLPMLSSTTGNATIPGVEGTFLLGLTGFATAPAVAYGSGNSSSIDLPLPNDTGLRGLRLYWQQLLIRGSQLKLGNRTSFQIQ